MLTLRSTFSGCRREASVVKQLSSLWFLDAAVVHLLTGGRHLYHVIGPDRGEGELSERSCRFLCNITKVSLCCVIPEHFGKLEALYTGFRVH